ncbi:hypothetical protein B0H13DRAFT_1851982 [Mycena leptocephala]|nr:hypothetical protein B0H13DRAFT_1851982 [Mycena leptocephala]
MWRNKTFVEPQKRREGYPLRRMPDENPRRRAGRPFSETGNRSYHQLKRVKTPASTQVPKKSRPEQELGEAVAGDLGGSGRYSSLVDALNYAGAVNAGIGDAGQLDFRRQKMSGMDVQNHAGALNDCFGRMQRPVETRRDGPLLRSESAPGGEISTNPGTACGCGRKSDNHNVVPSIPSLASQAKWKYGWPTTRSGLPPVWSETAQASAGQTVEAELIAIWMPRGCSWEILKVEFLNKFSCKCST